VLSKEIKVSDAAMMSSQSSNLCSKDFVSEDNRPIEKSGYTNAPRFQTKILVCVAVNT